MRSVAIAISAKKLFCLIEQESRFIEAMLHLFDDMLPYLSRLVPADHLEDYSYLCDRRSDARLLLLTPGAVLQQCLAAPFFLKKKRGSPYRIEVILLNLQKYLRL